MSGDVKFRKILDRMEASPKSIRFKELLDVCENFFERRPSSGGSHVSFKVPWVGDPRINIQNDKGMAKVYQVRQVLLAVKKLKKESF